MLPAISVSGLELGEELGRGAFSVVYRALREGVPCAVKIPRVRGRWTKWVYREAVALARVRHPALPAVFEVGEVDDLPYMVMELVVGETLATRLEGGPIGEPLTLTIGQQVASGLAAVHDAGLVHRDVKPRNIILEPGGRARLVDFGFATPIERVGSPSAGGAGTPAYAAPEQLRVPPSVDGRADLYALGRVLAECRRGAGRLVADGRRGHLALVSDGAEPPQRTPLDRVIDGLIQDSPDARYPDARALLTELDRVRQGRPILGPAGYVAGQRPQPLVGRDTELQRLTQAWASVGLTTGSVVVVRGPRGSGKTRLLAAYAGRIRESGGRRLLDARCREGDVPLATLRRIFESYLDSLARSSADEQAMGEEALRAAAADDLGRFATLIAPKLSAILGPETPAAGAAPDGFAEGAVELLVRLARSEGPLAVSVDDAQWLDPVSREVLVRLAHRVDGAPLLLTLAVRSEVPAPGLAQILALDRGRTLVLDMEPFGEDQIGSLVASHLGVSRADAGLVRRIAALADGTPLGAIEVLGAFLDTGALRPHVGGWVIDAALADRVTLPEGTLALLGRRLGDVPLATRHILEAATILGASFKDELLARVVDVELSDLGFALADGRRAGVLEWEADGRHRFVHDSLRDRLQSSLQAGPRRALHQRAAEALDRHPAPDFDVQCEIALHYAAGEIGKTPGRAYHAARAAAKAALDRFDNETALTFLDSAREAAGLAGLALDTNYQLSLGESRLRQGLFDESLTAFEHALDTAEDPNTRAAILGRISWVHLIRADADRAWQSLARAFAALGTAMPGDTGSSVAHTLSQVIHARFAGRPARATLKASRTADELRGAHELLCELHYQNGRLGVEHGKPLRSIQSALEGLAASNALGPCRARERARATHGFVLVLLGLRGAGEREIVHAQRMASTLRDPSTETFGLQLEALAACFTGDFDRALELLERCVVGRGHWLELSEYCHDAAAAELIESVRGRSIHAWAWISRATDRLRRSHPVTGVFAGPFVHRATAALAAQGRSALEDPWLATQLAGEALGPRRQRGHDYIPVWGPRARSLVERGDIGAEFDALVAAFESEGYHPRLVHPIMVEYYIAVAHGRLHQCLRCLVTERAPHVAALKKALKDLRAAARLPLFKAHRIYIEGCVAWLEGSPRRADELFSEAGRLAIEQTCPWVLYGIARVRGHALRDAGKIEAARDQGRIAEALAREHGSEPRARWIREEFALPSPVIPGAHTGTRSSRSSRTAAANHAKKQLAALLHVIRAPSSDLDANHQARAVLDDLMRAVDAERGQLWFDPAPETHPAVRVGRTRAQEDWPVEESWHEAMLRDVRDVGLPWPPEPDVEDLTGSVTVPLGIDAARVLAVPLFLQSDAVGAVYLERGHDAPAFAVEERELAVVLSYQVPVSIELARLLAEREHIQASLQQAQRMDAVGRLASGVAHDFQNMLNIIIGSVTAIRALPDLDPQIEPELRVIDDAAARAGRLVSRMLGFSRERTLLREPCSLNDQLQNLRPLLERLLGDGVTLRWDLDPDIEPVSIERASFDQVLVNLVSNAKDAMPTGGTITIRTFEITRDTTSTGGRAYPGEHTVLEITDTGNGILAENLPRVFDPFFTTKPAGTGIGLTTAYAFARRSEGRIDITSEFGRGTTCRLYFPKPPSDAAERQRDAELARPAHNSGTFPRVRRADPH